MTPSRKISNIIIKITAHSSPISYMILSDGKNDILLSTEYGLSSFYPQTKIFHNWTKEQGLQSDHFNANSGTLRKNGNAIFGSTDGAIEFPKKNGIAARI